MATDTPDNAADAIDFMIKLADVEGIACSTVSNGHILVFKKTHLEGILKHITDKGSDKAIVFVKRPDFNSVN